MRLPNLRRSEIDYKFSIVYAWHSDCPTIPIALRELKRQLLSKLKHPNGASFTTDQSEILQEQMNFYKALYTSKFNNHKSSVANNNLPLFSENITPFENADKLSYEGKVTQAECLQARKDFKNEKSPGTDGLQAEFHKYFWKELHADDTQF